MKSKTSESLIASESKAEFKKDGADQHKQKPLKKGKKMLAVVKDWKSRFLSFYSAVIVTNEPLFLLYVNLPSSMMTMLD